MSSASQLLYGSIQGESAEFNSVNFGSIFPSTTATASYSLPVRVEGLCFLDENTIVYIDQTTSEWVKYDISTDTELLRSGARPEDSFTSLTVARSIRYPGTILTGSRSEDYNYYDADDLSFIEQVRYGGWPSNSGIQHVNVVGDYMTLTGDQGSAGYERRVNRILETNVDDAQSIGAEGFNELVFTTSFSLVGVRGSHCKGIAGTYCATAVGDNVYATTVINKDGYTDMQKEVFAVSSITDELGNAVNLSSYAELRMTNYMDDRVVLIATDTGVTDYWIMDTQLVLDEDLPAP